MAMSWENQARHALHQAVEVLKNGPVGREWAQYEDTVQQWSSAGAEAAEQFHATHSAYLEWLLLLQLLQIAYEVRCDKRWQAVHWLYQLLVHVLVCGAGLLGFALVDPAFQARCHAFLSRHLLLSVASWWVMHCAPGDLGYRGYRALRVEHLGRAAKVTCGLTTTFALLSFARPHFPLVSEWPVLGLVLLLSGASKALVRSACDTALSVALNERVALTSLSPSLLYALQAAGVVAVGLVVGVVGAGGSERGAFLLAHVVLLSNSALASLRPTAQPFLIPALCHFVAALTRFGPRAPAPPRRK